MPEYPIYVRHAFSAVRVIGIEQYENEEKECEDRLFG